ncbi:unnamed protein product [Closterium sp. Naga37s-1]|nr:unnamed protein product [Closterium sp. Naga37s-1]
MEESDSPHPSEQRQDGDAEQGDADAEAAGQEERSGVEAAPAKPTAEEEEVREEGLASAVSEGRRAQAEPTLAAAESAGEELTVEEAPSALAAAEEPAEEEEMASAAKADCRDAMDDGRADPAGGGSTAFDQMVGDTQGFGSPGRNADHAPIRRSIRLQPSPRRLGAGLTPGLPGPLRGWECQTYPPRPHGEGPSRPCPSSAGAEEEEAGELPAEEEVLRPPIRSGPWRERHGRPEVVSEEGIADRPAAADNDEEEEAYMASEEGESEEVSLDDEPGVGNHQGNARSGRS